MQEMLGTPKEENGLVNLAVDPDMLARELEAEQQGDPLDDICPNDTQESKLEAIRECDAALNWLQQDQQQRLQGLRVFCEHRDSRAVPLLLPLLEAPCPIIRMSAVYALGRNPSTKAVNPLIRLLRVDSNAFVRKATAWSLGNYSDAPVIYPLIHALQTDVASVRLWATASLAEAGMTSAIKADLAASQLLLALRVDAEPIVRSNCIWALGQLHNLLVISRQEELVNAVVIAFLRDREPTVRDEAHSTLEQLGDPDLLRRLQLSADRGFSDWRGTVPKVRNNFP